MDMEGRNVSVDITTHSSDSGLVSCIAVRGTISLLGITLNSIAIIIILHGKTFGKSIKIQLLNLAITDLLYAALAPSLGILTLCLPSYPGNRILCKLQQYIVYSIALASVLGNAVIGLERFVAVYFPLRMSSYRKRHVTMVVLATWILAFVLQIDIAVDSGLTPDVDNTELILCRLGQEGLTANRSIKLAIPLLIVKFLLPITTILITYMLICVKLKRPKRVGTSLSHRRKRNDKVGSITYSEMRY
jgi:hypothetical protein